MGGAELEDSRGRLWLGDGGGIDPLNIRPNDGSGTNMIENWCVADSQIQFDSLEALGFDAFNDSDQRIFNTIRWDTGNDGQDFRVVLPIPNGVYTVNCYFTECCCPNRHFKIEIQGEIVDDDVSYLDYDEAFPALGRTGRLGFPGVQVNDQTLTIGFLPCPACPGATDTNAIIDAIEVLSGDRCDQFGLDFNCVYDPAGDRVNGTWQGIAGVTGFVILKNGQPFGAPLGSDIRSFTDPAPRSGGPGGTSYTIRAVNGANTVAECDAFVQAFSCIKNLQCAVTPGAAEVALLWDPAGGVDITGIQVYRNGALLATLPGNATTFEDNPDVRNSVYRVVPVTQPAGACGELTCSAQVEGLPFSTPLRINMGGPALTDSKGRIWLGDRNPGDGENTDPLGIRVDLGHGFHSIINWCAPNVDAITKVGFDPNNGNDRALLTTIRWDEGGDGIGMAYELPLRDDVYLVNMYFNECCCTGRHFQIELEGEIVDDDVSYLDYDPVPALAKVGKLAFPGIVVEDGALSIVFHPCPQCPGTNDTNAIVNAIEVLTQADLCEDPEFFQCTTAMNCAVNRTREVALSWDPPLCVALTGWDLFRNGALLTSLPADARTFEDTTANRVTQYELRPKSAAGEPTCEPYLCTATCACPSNLQCSDDGAGNVTATWDPPGCDGIVQSYELRLNGSVIQNLPGTATSFAASFTTRIGAFELVPVLAAGQEPCPGLHCDFLNPNVATFDIPLRLNMGGPSFTDSRGQLWIGDRADPGDFLLIRPNPAGGTNTIVNWCVPLSRDNADSMQSLGLDPFTESDQAIYNSIRWDLGDDDGDFLAGELNDIDGGDVDFRLAIPVPNGNYLVSTYFTECCCPNRLFQIEIQGEIVAESVSAASYSALGTLGRTGRLSFDNISVANNVLEINFLPCAFDCPPGTDFNAIIDAIEVLPAGTQLKTCPRDLICSTGADGASMRLSWSAPQNVTVTGYDVYRNGAKIASIAGNATSFTDPLTECMEQLADYELVPLFQPTEEFCPDSLRLRCRGINCFKTPLRINMGGPEVVDSLGRRWIEDRRPGAPENDDPLSVRPNDAGGLHSIIDWCFPAADTLTKLGFDPNNASDRTLLSTIRWDEGQDANEFRVELPITNGTYDVNMYFNECCCTNRHFKIEIEGEIVDDDVSYLDYDANPGLGRVGLLTFPEVDVADRVLSLAFLPCPECVGGGDNNAIVNAVEVIAAGGPPPGTRYKRGDCNADGNVNIADASYLLNFLFLGGPDPKCAATTDANDDGTGNIADASFILNFLFLGGRDIPPPNTCEDRGEEGVDCASYPPCPQ
jgi:hypothetical protein